MTTEGYWSEKASQSRNDRREQDSQRQYEETKRLQESVTRILIEIGRLEVRSQERHEVASQTILQLQQSLNTFVPRHEIENRLLVIKDEHEDLVNRHNALHKDYKESSDRQIKIISYATMAGTALGGIISYALRKLGIIS